MPPYTPANLTVGAPYEQAGQNLIDMVKQKLFEQELKSKLATEGLQRNVTQEDLNAKPALRATQGLETLGKFDPTMGAETGHLHPGVTDLLSQASGAQIPKNYLPLELQVLAQRQGLMNSAFGGAPGGAPPPQGAPSGPPPGGGPSQANPAAPPQANGAGPSPAGPPPGGPSPLPSIMTASPQASSPGYVNFGGKQLTPDEFASFRLSGKLPDSTAFGKEEGASAAKAGELNASRNAGVLPEADAKFVQDAMSYYTQLEGASKALQDPHISRGGMAYENWLYNHKLGNSEPYAPIVGALDLGKQQILTDLASGVRNPAVRAAIGIHLPSASQTPVAIKQRLDNILRSYPYMVYSRYATRGVKMPDAVRQGMGYDDPAKWDQYLRDIESGKPGTVGSDRGNTAPAGPPVDAPPGRGPGQGPKLMSRQLLLQQMQKERPNAPHSPADVDKMAQILGVTLQ